VSLQCTTGKTRLKQRSTPKSMRHNRLQRRIHKGRVPTDFEMKIITFGFTLGQQTGVGFGMRLPIDGLAEEAR
jgi:hypothetical protein